MNPVLAYEKPFYFRSKFHYFTSWITHEDNYLIWKYLCFLRREEAATNKLTAYYWRRRKNDLGAKLGILIYAGCCGKGLRIWHGGNIMISATIGENCTLHGAACIGNNGITPEAPVVGNNVDVGIDAKVIGNVRIADNVRIGASAVVTKSCLEEGVTLVGIPAKALPRK